MGSSETMIVGQSLVLRAQDIMTITSQKMTIRQIGKVDQPSDLR